jgi:hypothetical protein
MPEVNNRSERLDPRRSPSNPGRMTAVMRSVRQAMGPKVLRVGVVVAARLLEERVFQRRTTVTVGPGERATFVVEADLPPQFKLFERIGDDYYLNTLDGMTGRLALPTGIADLVTLRDEARSAGASGALRLTEEMRGKLVMGGVTFLFQFVTPPPVHPRPRLPLSGKDGVASQIDWKLAVIVALSFLLHFGLVGGMYSDWMDTVVDDDITVGLIHAIESTRPPAVETTTDATAESATETETPAPTTTPAASTANRNRPGPGSPAAILDGLMNELGQVNVAIIGSLKGGPNLRGVMTSGDNGAPVSLNELGRREARIGNASGEGLDLPAGVGGPIHPGRTGFTLPTGETGATSTGAGRMTRVVLAPMVHEESPVLSAPVADAEAVIRKQIHPGAKRCYQKGLDSDPSQSGKLVLVIRVAPSGEVDSATVSSNAGVSAGVAECIVGVARRAKFERTGPGGATVVVPFGFVRQGG